MKKIKKILTSFVVLSSLFLFSSLSAGQIDESNFTTLKYYNINRQLTGIIYSDPDGSGAAQRFAERNFYNSLGLLVATEFGYIISAQSQNLSPGSWSGFTVEKVHRYTYDAWGKKLTFSIENAVGIKEAQTQYSYDSNGRLTCEAIRMNPNAFGSLPASACVLNSVGGYGADRVTRYSYDSKDRITSIEKAVGTPLAQKYVSYTYNKYWEREGITDANGNYAKLEYDGFGRLTRWYFPSKTSKGTHNPSDFEQYTYDANNNKTAHRKRDGNVISYQYDALNRVERKDVVGTLNDVFYRYDNRNLEIYARFGSVSGKGINTTYDGFGRVVTSVNSMFSSAKTLTYTYDSNGNRTRITHPDGQYISYAYDGSDRQVALCENSQANGVLQPVCSDATKTLAAIKYNNMQLAREVSIPGGVVTKYAYDSIYRPASFSHNFSGTAQDFAVAHTYNPANQVLTRTLSNNLYLYSGNQNLTGNYTVNGLNQYETVSGKKFVYDANGNLTNDGANSYVYDIENRLVGVSGGKSASIKYDPKGRLFELTSNGSVTQFLYDGDALVAEYNSTNVLLQRYVHSNGVDRPMVWYVGSTVTPSSRRYLHSDHQGSIIAVSNNLGASVATNRYDTYGIPQASNLGRFSYTGQIYLPEIGLHYYKARIYSSQLGRFLQTDPIGYEDQMNLYAYVGNDPVNMVDPTGEFGIVGALIGAGVEAAIQIGTTGKVSDWKAVGVAGAVGAVTGGVGGRLATQALQGTMSASRAVATTAAVGGAANGVGTVASNAIDGKATTATEAAVAVVGGAAGAGAGAKIANQVASKLDNLGKSSGLGQHIADATRASYGGGAAAEAGASAGETAGAVAAEAAANLAQKELNERR